jgi:hypothetical protein
LAANVEAGLDAAIDQVLCIQDRPGDDLFTEDGPLTNFSRKIAMGHALRIFGTTTQNNLTIIRHVRNAFAHAKIPIHFDTSEVKDLCNDLTRIALVPPHVIQDAQLDKSGLTTRELFEDVCNATAHNLFVYSLNPILEIDGQALKVSIPAGYSITAQREPIA